MTATYTAPLQMTDGFLMTANYWNEQVTNNLDYAFSRPLLDVSDLDGTVSNTSSTSFVDITGASGDITSETGRILCIATLSVSGNGANQSVYTFSVAGSDAGNATYGLGYLQGTSTVNMIVIVHLASVTAGAATTIKLRHRVTGGTSTVTAFNMKVIEF
jgi:hypothetical protein